MILVYFLAWTLTLYWIHRIAHEVSWIRSIHLEHHRYVLQNKTGWHWSNLFLFNDTWMCTLDLWISEVIPTLIFSLITGHWWISVFYYVWAAFIQEPIEHNKNFNIPVLTSGKWHMIHHRSEKNYGLFTSFWDRVFNTNMKVV